MRKIIGASGRFDATAREIRDALDSDFEEFEADIDLRTEGSPRSARSTYATYAYKHHLHLLHFAGNDGENESLILSKRPMTDHKLHRLTNMTLMRGHEVHVQMPTAMIAGLWVGALHTPAHNEGLRHGVHNTAVYRDMLEGLRRAVREMPGHRAIHGDWNLAIDAHRNAAVLLAHHPRMHFIVPDKATEGDRKIDALMTTEEGHALVLPGMPGFDHKRVLNHLKD